MSKDTMHTYIIWEMSLKLSWNKKVNLVDRSKLSMEVSDNRLS